MYRVIIEYDHDGARNLDGCDGKPLPEAPDVYAENQYMKDGKPVPYEDYLKYYGNPDRHVVLMAHVMRQCEHCGSWTDAPGDTALAGIDFMDDDRDADRVGSWTPEEIASWPAGSYLRVTALELLEAAGHEGSHVILEAARAENEAKRQADQTNV
jgi:hypothetical protein